MRFEELRHQLDDALEFCASLGLAEAIKTSRFKEYKALIQRLCEIIQTYTLESLPTEIDQELRERNVEYVLSLTESLEFVGTLHFLKTCEQDVIYRKLQRILSGPLLPKDENENSNEPRNTLFELNLASKLWKAGLAPSIEMVADIE